jgi:hypothetical protein
MHSRELTTGPLSSWYAQRDAGEAGQQSSAELDEHVMPSGQMGTFVREYRAELGSPEHRERAGWAVRR